METLGNISSEWGGAYVSSSIQKALTELRENYPSILDDSTFKENFERYQLPWAASPTPLLKAEQLSVKLGAPIYLKREDLAKTGTFKMVNALSQVLLARMLGKPEIIAETGSGHHGMAVATACWLLKMPCTVFMGAKDIKRQAYNAERIRQTGANLVEVTLGTQTVKSALDELMQYWDRHAEKVYYIPGSAYGPDPYPKLTMHFQSLIGKEMRGQFLEMTNGLPTHVLAETGRGGAGTAVFPVFMNDNKVKLIGAQPSGRGINTGKTAAAVLKGESGIVHGMKTLVLKEGDDFVSHCIAPGMDYAAADPFYVQWNEQGKIKFEAINDFEAMEAAYLLMDQENIVPSLEAAHAIALLRKIQLQPEDKVVICLSGNGEKDLEKYKVYADVMK